jgi:uncharacterized membrane protein
VDARHKAGHDEDTNSGGTGTMGISLREAIEFFFAFVISWLITLHLTAADFGKNFTEIIGSKKWVRATDYIYLFISIISILSLFLKINGAGNQIVSINLWLPILLSFAVAIRITKTSIEVFGWS